MSGWKTPSLRGMMGGSSISSAGSSPLARQEAETPHSLAESRMTPRRSSARGNRASRSENAGNEVGRDGRLVNESKAGRVKVGIRCRPAFQDEIDFAKGQFVSIVDTTEEDSRDETLGRVTLTLLSGKQRDFMFDYVFHQQSSQDAVFERIARPVVDDVLRGFNGTVFAYGQTGTGKTYTMGILESVEDEHAGIIPRAIARIFEYEQGDQADEVRVTLSFLQLYRETIQDLLAPANSHSAPAPRGHTPGKVYNDENLVIREDPQRGFYVEGLQEFIVRDYSEAEALINLGLENRAIAPTLMNATSSRSHTVLTLHVEQRGLRTGGMGTKNVRSKLLMVDLAGSERVRRTVSKGTRLNEARSINSSLSTLGNVIAALAEEKTTHVPYRDSKLTRLLQDSLGGTASTALIATVGPAAMNYSETLSTLLFAARCMAVKTTPIQHEEVDYAQMCAQLQERLSTVETRLNDKHQKQQVRYQQQIQDLQDQLDRGGGGGGGIWDDDDLGSQGGDSSVGGGGGGGLRGGASRQSQANLENVLMHLKSLEGAKARQGGRGGWMQKSFTSTADGKVLLPLLSYSFELVKALANDLVNVLNENGHREEQRKIDMITQFSDEADRESVRELEQEAMTANDPLSDEEAAGKFRIGKHLARLTKLEALTRVEGLYRGEGGGDRSRFDPILPPGQYLKDDLSKYKSPEELAEALTGLHDSVAKNTNRLNILMARKDSHFKGVKDELCSEMVEKRRREEEVVNWSYILKYLLSSQQKLRKQWEAERRLRESLEHRLTDGGDGGTSGGNHPQSPGVTTGGGIDNTDMSLSPLERVRARMEIAKAEEEGRMVRGSNNSGGLGRSGGSSGGIKGVLSRLVKKNPSEQTKRMAMERNIQSAQEAERDLQEQQGNDSEDDWVAEDSEGSDEGGIYDDTTNNYYANNNRRGNPVQQVQSPVRMPAQQQQQQQQQRSSPTANGAGVTRAAVPGTGRGRVSILESKVSGMWRPNPGKATPEYHEPEPEVQGSGFAKKVVSELGVKGEDASAAAAIIDRVRNITPEQLEALDPATRAQVMRVRADLKLDAASAAKNNSGSGSNNKKSKGASPRYRSTQQQQMDNPAPEIPVVGSHTASLPFRNRTPSFSEKSPTVADVHEGKRSVAQPVVRQQPVAKKMVQEVHQRMSESHLDEDNLKPAGAPARRPSLNQEVRAKRRQSMLDML